MIWDFKEEESRLAPMATAPRSVTPIVGERDVNGPPAPTGRICALCPAVLSKWNDSPVCGPCQREARAIYPPLEVPEPMVVYYAEGDGLIKIGVTRNVVERLTCLRLRLLASEPGDFAVEAERHKTFAAHRAHGEWFHPAPELVEHIERLAS